MKGTLEFFLNSISVARQKRRKKNEKESKIKKKKREKDELRKQEGKFN